MVVRFIVLSCLLLAYTFDINAQGCSDAGFCTMGAMKPDQPFNKKVPVKLRSMEISFYRASTTLSPIIYVATADLNFNIIDSKTSFQVKLPYQGASGNFGKTGGLGDISLCFTRNVHTSESFDINISVGGKIPSNHANKEIDGNPAPMYYQTSLGTYDFITGVSLISRKWLFATGIQIPFIHKNENEFTWNSWPDYPSQAYVMKYDPAYHLKRGTDVMFRAERNFRFSRFNASLGLLPILRVTNDEIESPPGSGERVKPEGAKGLAMSVIGTFGYNFNVQSGVKLLVGHKIIQRDENPDGLTRELVTTISYYYRF